jgi:5-methylcytosine-specific restriction endonuclease McrA
MPNDSRRINMNTESLPSIPSRAAGVLVESREAVQRATYADKLRDVRWQKRRLETFNKSGWLCDRCECADSTLHVHHKEYIAGREPWDYPDELLETLCEKCHAAEHGKDKAPAPPPAEPPLNCARCKARLHVADVAGWDGKNEPICEVCAMAAEREEFDSRS